MKNPEHLTIVPSYKWAKEVKELYHYTCVNCGTSATGRMMHAHHVVPVHENSTLSNALENGVALCYKCHMYGVHDGNGNISNTERAKKIMDKIIEMKSHERIIILSNGQKKIIMNN